MELDLIQVSVGLPQKIGDNPTTGAPVISSIVKQPVLGRWIEVTPENLVGDEQADKRLTRDKQTDLHRRIHGGPLQAVYVYPGEHLEAWKQDTGLDFDPAAFGENFTTWGGCEDSVRVDDVFECDGVRFRVIKPRRPCAKLPLHLRIEDIAERMIDTGRCGWYLAVEQPGIMPVNGTLKLVSSDPARPTIAEVFAHKKEADLTIPDLP